MRTILFCLLLTAATLPAEEPDAGASPVESALAGLNFAITITSSDGDTSPDVLHFAGATLASDTYAASRFVAGPVVVTGTKDACTFHAVLASPRGAEAVFNGTVTGDAIEGTVVAGIKGGGEKATFTGKRQP